MFFEDYEKTGLVYHVAHITDLKKILIKGISYDDKISYKQHYYSFHKYIDDHRPPSIPPWVVRERAIFASMNYKDNSKFHSHSAILALNIDMSKCWIANENKANQIYEPFIIKAIDGFQKAEAYLKNEGKKLLADYWHTSISFQENLKIRRDLKEGYDGEVLIFHKILPKDIKLLYIVSDHRMLTVEQWKSIFCE